MIEITGERFLPWMQDPRIHYEHLHRYALAAQLVKGKKVLDLACGEGYGSYMLAQEAAHVVGVDRDEQVVSHAEGKYSRDGLHFMKGSIAEIPMHTAKDFDVIVCFEAIEHVEDHDGLLSEVKRLLKDDGLFIVSTPNKATYTDEPKYHNPFHLRELYFTELKKLLTSYFKTVRFLGQRVYTGSNIWDISAKQHSTCRESLVERGEKEFHEVRGVRKTPLYFIALASDADVTPHIRGASDWLVDVSDALTKGYDRQFSEMSNLLQSKDSEIGGLNAALQSKDSQIGGLNAALQEKGGQITQLSDALQSKDSQIGGLNAALQSKDSEIGGLNAALQEKGGQITQLNDALQSKDSQIGGLNAALQEKSTQINDLNNILQARDAQVRNLEMQMHQRERGIPRQLLKRYDKVAEKLLPSGTRRRHFYLLQLKALRVLLNEGVRSFFSKARTYIKNRAFRQANPYHRPKTPHLNVPTTHGEEIRPCENDTISIVVPTKNGGHDFELLLSMLKVQRGLQHLQIVVVDSGSSDHTVDIARTYGATVVHIPPKEFSHSHARNVGAQAATGHYLFFTVQDALPSSNLFLYELLNALKSNDAAAVSCEEFPREDADLFYRAINWNHYKRFLELEEDRVLHLPKVRTYGTLRKNGQVSDIACLISKELFEKYRFRGDYAEDLDLGMRLIEDGHKLALLQSVKVIHSHNRSPYYWFQRAYVDTLGLSRLFPDYPVPKIEERQALRDILPTYRALEFLVEEELSKIEKPIATDSLFAILSKALGASVDLRASSLSFTTSDFFGVDQRLGATLKRILDADPISAERGSSGNVMTSAVLGHMNMVKEYMKSPHPIVDAVVLEDFTSCLFKAYAWQAGAHLAVSCLNGYRIDGLDRELREGV